MLLVTHLPAYPAAHTEAEVHTAFHTEVGAFVPDTLADHPPEDPYY